MAQGVVVLFDEQADAEIRALWARLDATGLPSARKFPPHLTLAMATDIPKKTRSALRADLGLLSIPSIWLAALSTFSASENVLMLAAVTDAELLAVHSAVHDVLAGKVRNPNAYYLPGSWMPHCTLVQGVSEAEVVTGFGTVFPVPAIRARARQVAVIDTATMEIDPIVACP
ncbi:2'-5' RNA ligase family protein [Alloactinosynnema sp. L-07]|uniref:2'-5' RNA ligase family protein n=1 Tax=Alloactinosynnema sp. L-07 TaxID=1653480 RepID=UPI0006B4F21C|nr:2'-5' RNA ligase family protein [Alloactinosynnema sp. L-07]